MATDYLKTFPRKRDLPDALRQLAGTDHTSAIMRAAADRIEELERMDREAAEYVETQICTRTRFTGNHPYVGWKGLGLALTEALDERDQLRKQLRKG